MTVDRLGADLDSMKKAAADALRFIEGMSEAEFLTDEKTQAAVAMCAIVLGEATVKIAGHSPEFVASHPNWPWHEIRGMRNRAVHGYGTLHLPTIWKTVTVSFPLLAAELDAFGDHNEQ